MGSTAKKWSQGIGVKLILIAALVGILWIFVGMQDGLVNERQYARNQAVAQTVNEWGGRQGLVGPILRVPYRETVRVSAKETVTTVSYAYVLPKRFDTTVKLRTERRQRGIYEVPLYLAAVRAEGEFAVPPDAALFPAGAQPLWGRARICFYIDSARGLAETPRLRFAGGDWAVDRPVANPKGLDAFEAAVPAGAASGGAFSLELNLRGGSSLALFPAGGDSRIAVAADAGYPDFGGAFLPFKRELRGSGFDAEWRVPALARKLPAFGTVSEWENLFASTERAELELGVAFDSYRLLNRAVKYGLLFIAVPFVGLFLYEIFSRRRIHPVQYLLVGFAVVLFYSLVLSLSERMDFNLAFALGGAAVSGLVGAYCAAILGGGRRGLACFGGMAALYGLLYAIIGSEDSALLVGSLFLFGLLALVMFATRRVDWYRLRSDDEAGAEGDGASNANPPPPVASGAGVAAGPAEAAAAAAADAAAGRTDPAP